jgi:hypothetical protein
MEQEKKLEGDILRAIQDYGITVEKEELIKALQYDRDQYRKGFIDGCRGSYDRLIERVKADTVKKMQELIKERCIEGGIYPAFVARTIDKIAKEILEGDPSLTSL